MPNTNLKKGCRVATSAIKPKSAVEDVLNDFDEIFDRAAATMTDQEFQEAEKQSKKLDRNTSPSRRRETA
jgi:hypothetical protein